MEIPKIGVVGSRSFNNYSLLESYLTLLIPFHLISGGAKGADQLAELFANENNLGKTIHLPDWKTFGKSAGFLRNQLIVLDSDFILAFWDGKSKGTKSTIDLAKRNNVSVEVILF